MAKAYWVKLLMVFGMFGAIQFLICTTIAMVVYPGGTIQEPFLEHYSFLYNFFSDLGRTRAPDGTPNTWTYSIYIASLIIAGLCTALYFTTLPFLFKAQTSKKYYLAAMGLGVVAGLCYIGIGMNPYNVDYYSHTLYVRAGFISFLFMSLAYAAAIYNEPGFPRKYAIVLLIFACVLCLQVGIMIFGPRSWTSRYALLLQASSQKIVVYAEILCMLYLSWGSLKYYNAKLVSNSR